MKALLCDAFCSNIEIRQVPAGYAVVTPYRSMDDDPIMFYIIREGTEGTHWRLEDDGMQVPLIEAAGVNISSGLRGDAFNALLGEYGVLFDTEARTLKTSPIVTDQIGLSSIQFLALLLRLQDLVLLTQERVKKAWREDALSEIHRSFDSIAVVEENAPVSDEFSIYPADAVIRYNESPPLAVYLGTSDARALQALVLKMELEKYRSIPCYVVLMVERSKDNPLNEPTYALSQARLDSVLTFRGAERDSMSAMQRMLEKGSLLH